MVSGVRTISGAQKNIAIQYTNLSIGGIQSIIVSQIKLLQDANYKVTLVLDKDSIDYDLPKNIKIEILPVDPEKKLLRWKRILEVNNIDTYIDHDILYNQAWVEFNKIAKELDVKSIGWIHNAFIRPILDFSTQNEFLNENIRRFDQIIVLSETDVHYYKLMGHKNIYFIPNPLPPTLVEFSVQDHKAYHQKDKLEIIWTGRAQQKTKRILDLIPAMQEITKEIPFAHLTVIGPFTWDIDKAEYENQIRNAGLENNVSVIGPKNQKELREYYKKADLAISTSVIEGFPVTLIEENAFGLPIVMYELPWLWIVKNNQGIKSVPQGDHQSLARSVVEIANNAELYESMSQAGVSKIQELRAIDFVWLYDQLIKNKLPKQYSPEPSTLEAKNILHLINDYYVRIRNEKQDEVNVLRADNINKQHQNNVNEAELRSHLGIKRSLRLLLGNIKRNLILGRIKNTQLIRGTVQFYKKYKKIKVAVLVGEFFDSTMPYNNIKGGYGAIARNYLAEYIPNNKIKIDTICGFNEGDELITHIVDKKKKVLFLPRDNEQNQQKIIDIIDSYDIFLSIEFQDIAYKVASKATKNQKLIYYIQDPRPQEDWVELDSVTRFRAIGYRPSQLTSSLMNTLYSENRLIAITQGKDFIEKARKFFSLPKSFDAKLIPNAVTVPLLTDAELKSKNNTVIALARLDIVKRPWIIGEVAKRMPEYNFVFAGQAHDEEMKEAMHPYLSLPNVKHTGHIEQKEKDKLLRESKVLINTSIHECIPVSFLEALAYGMPIVSNRNPDGITERFGYAVHQVNGDGLEEVDELIKGIKKFMEDDDFRLHVAREGINYINKTHNVDKFTNDIRNVIIKSYEK